MVKTLYRTAKTVTIALVASLLVCAMPHVADAELIAYEGDEFEVFSIDM